MRPASRTPPWRAKQMFKRTAINPGQSGPSVQELLAAAEAADKAANATSEAEEMRAVGEVLAHMGTIQMVLMNRKMQRLSTSPRNNERLPLRDEGDDIGRVEARIPKELYFHLRKQRNFGDEGFNSDEGMRDFLKAFPQCKVKTVSGKTTVGWRQGAAPNAGSGPPSPEEIIIGRQGAPPRA